MIRGACHCGQMTWSFDGVPRSGTACNCTLCRRYGVLWAYDYVDGRIGTSGTTQFYCWGDKELEFHFCPECGCVGWWLAKEAQADGRTRIAVNLRLAEPDDVGAIPLRRFEGLVSFKDLPPDGRCVADLWF